MGCSVVLKPSKFTSVTTLKLGEIFTEAGLPAGVLNIVTGSGETVGNELASNHKVDKIAITGSVDTGRTIIRNSAEDIKRISLELGGKSPNIVFADANMEAALNGAMGCFGNAGQVCNAPSRLLLEESIAKEFTEKLVERVKGLKVSMPNDPEAGMGPLISAEHLNKVLSYVDKGVKEGATLACGGKRLTDGEFANGNFMTPAVFTNVTNDMAVAREEIFGPVLVVETFKTTEEAIAIANDTPFGLASGVWTNSMDKANKVARELRAGLVWVNTWGGTIPELPNGGYKQSGYGRELGPEAFENFTQTKAVHLCVL